MNTNEIYNTIEDASWEFANAGEISNNAENLINAACQQRDTIHYLAGALVVSISISCLAVGYVAKLQGWF